MRQFRKDPLSDRWVAYAEGRDDRPNEYESDRRRLPGTRCPFCAGHEEDTPPQIAIYPPTGQSTAASNGQDWLVRVVPNKYPAFRPESSKKICQEGLYEGAGAVGEHEVIVDSPRHIASLSQLSDEELATLMLAYRDRMLDLRKKYVYALVFKNVGPQAGASLEHAHSQVVATPMVPVEVAREIAAAKRLFDEHQACFFCRVIADELEHRERFVDESEHFVAVCPYASRMPYEMWILPRAHASHFEQQTPDQLAELGKFLQELIRKLESLHGHLAYNYFVHTGPFDTSALRHYHWHIEVFPRLTTTAGFEWGAGYYINPVPPEQAAAILRS
jgi:UDPglucose--hexose-1-phosphate uridylyltransferase